MIAAVRELAEQSLLGSILLRPELIERCDGLHFFYPWNAAVYQALRSVPGDVYCWPVITLMAADDSVEKLRAVGGREYFITLLQAGAEPVADFDDLVRLVKSCPRCHQ